VLTVGLPGTSVDVCRYGAVSCQLETSGARVYPASIKGLGRPSRVERGLLSDSQRSDGRRRVRLLVVIG